MHLARKWHELYEEMFHCFMYCTNTTLLIHGCLFVTANLCLVAMQSGESLLHGCATFGFSELLKELVTQYDLDINQPNHVRTERSFASNIYSLLLH